MRIYFTGKSVRNQISCDIDVHKQTFYAITKMPMTFLLSMLISSFLIICKRMSLFLQLSGKYFNIYVIVWAATAKNEYLPDGLYFNCSGAKAFSGTTRESCWSLRLRQ